MGQYRIDFNSIPWQAPAAGVRFKAHEQAGRKLRLAEFSKDFVEPDWCAKGHIGYVLKGQLEIDFSGNAVSFNPGDGIFIPPGEQHKHKGRVITETVRLILVEDA
jgi:quercetin dioxygenase-like cupin family protein